MNDKLLAELTRIAHHASPEAKAWIGRHVSADIRDRARTRGEHRRGVKVRFPRGGSGVLAEQYVRERGVPLVDSHAAVPFARRHRGDGGIGQMTREAIAKARLSGAESPNSSAQEGGDGLTIGD